jgi:hypothetical protein
MENIDRFFDSYDRLVPRWFADAAMAGVIVLLVTWIFF